MQTFTIADGALYLIPEQVLCVVPEQVYVVELMPEQVWWTHLLGIPEQVWNPLPGRYA